MGKPTICIDENKGADQIRSEADQRLCFRYTDSIVGTMKLVRRLVLTKNTPMILKAKLGIKLKVIMSPFIFRLLLGQKSVASYWKMGR